MNDRARQVTARIKFLAQQVRSQQSQSQNGHDSESFGHDSMQPHDCSTVGISEVSLLLDMPRLPRFT
jgi:hypothetical protein